MKVDLVEKREDLKDVKYRRIRNTAERINILIEESGLTLEEFGKKIDLSMEDKSIPPYLSAVRKGRKEVDIDIIINISRKFNVSIEWLLGISRFDIRRNKYYNIQKLTGLSENAIDKLKKYNLKTDAWQSDIFYCREFNYVDYIKILSNIIENENFEPLLFSIRSLINLPILKEMNKKVKHFNSHVNTTEEELLELHEEEISEDEYEYLNEIYGYDLKKIEVDDITLTEFRIEKIFNEIVKSVFEGLSKEASSKWQVIKQNDGKLKVFPICKDGSESNPMFGYNKGVN